MSDYGTLLDELSLDSRLTWPVDVNDLPPGVTIADISPYGYIPVKAVAILFIALFVTSTGACTIAPTRNRFDLPRSAALGPGRLLQTVVSHSDGGDLRYRRDNRLEWPAMVFDQCSQRRRLLDAVRSRRFGSTRRRGVRPVRPKRQKYVQYIVLMP